jgi:MoxR-like ATPase
VETFLEGLERIFSLVPEDRQDRFEGFVSDTQLSGFHGVGTSFSMTVEDNRNRPHKVVFYYGFAEEESAFDQEEKCLKVKCEKIDHICEFNGEQGPPCKHVAFACKILLAASNEVGDVAVSNSETINFREIEEHLFPFVKEEKVDPESQMQSLLRTTRVLLYGPPGSGKTHGIMSALGALKDRGEVDSIYLVPCSDGMEDTDLLSKTVPLGPQERLQAFLDLKKANPTLPENVLLSSIGEWSRTEGVLRKIFIEARTKRVAVVLDELSRAGASARNLILKALDPVTGRYELHDFMAGETLYAGLDSILWSASCNMGAAYAQASTLDEALLDRFESTLFVDYDTKVESELMAAAGISDEMVRSMARCVATLRHAYKSGSLPSPLSTRMVKGWAAKVAKGQSLLEAAETTWLYRIVDRDDKGYPDESQVSTIKKVVKREEASISKRSNANS